MVSKGRTNDTKYAEYMMTCIYFKRQICETQVICIYRIIKTRTCWILLFAFIS